MTEVKVGDVWENEKNTFVVSEIFNGNIVETIHSKGRTNRYYTTEFILENYNFVAHYETFIEAISSKEFRGE